jgi:hypothetical protein
LPPPSLPIEEEKKELEIDLSASKLLIHGVGFSAEHMNG